MTLIEGVLKDHVFIDFCAEISYGTDMVDGIPFATVTFQLMDTALLSQIADRIRIAEGHRPMHPLDEYTDEDCDQDGWYDFFFTVNDLPDGSPDTCIGCVVVSLDAQDNEQVYAIDLGPDECMAMYRRLDEQCRRYLGKNCTDLLAEAGKELGENS